MLFVSYGFHLLSPITGLFAGQEEDSTPPPANQRVLEGQAKFQNLLLAPPPHDFIPYQLMDELKVNGFTMTFLTKYCLTFNQSQTATY